ncbi:uncharacterized protein Dyak_GE27572 [Drosophila yakuba]|uniref:Uncharacterized protein n=1 Tax=Drosophila yakuba TaxID=7245 RepID=A0A0R1EAC2_DROYA|nr:uncharacterized protein Dyak_GE27572 [Drosophila yakuba]
MHFLLGIAAERFRGGKDRDLGPGIWDLGVVGLRGHANSLPYPVANQIIGQQPAFGACSAPTWTHAHTTSIGYSDDSDSLTIGMENYDCQIRKI